MATKQTRSNPFMSESTSQLPDSMPVYGDQTGGGVNIAPGNRQKQSQVSSHPPSFFDFFYEEFLTNVMKDKELSEKVPQEFVQLHSDYERVEYLLNLSSSIRDFQIRSKLGVKSLERSTKYREEGNKLFQTDQTVQSILFYNKSIAYAPHPNIDEYSKPPPPPEKITSVQLKNYQAPPPEELPTEEVPSTTQKPVTKGEKPMKKKSEPRKPASPYEPLSFCYANRSAALRKLCQYEECLMDIARAAKFGYPKENVFKLWERKGKCYLGLKRYELAHKCLRQSIHCLKESNLTDNQKAQKNHELQALLKEWRNTHLMSQMAEGHGGSLHAQNAKIPEETETKEEKPIMGATGPLVLIKETPPDPKKKLSMVQAELAQQQAQQQIPSLPNLTQYPTNSLPPRPERLNRQPSGGRRKISPGSDLHSAASPQGSAGSPVGPTPPLTPNSETDSYSVSGSAQPNSLPPLPQTSASPTTANIGENLHKTSSQISISQLSTGGVIKLDDIEIPELSYGQNPRMPSASIGIEVQYDTEKGRFFSANRDLYPGRFIMLGYDIFELA